MWDLNAGGRLLHMIRGAHDGAITAIQWVPGQPVLITSGEDNSVKVRMSAKYFNSTQLTLDHSAMAFRVSYRSSQTSKIPFWSPCTPSSNPVLW